MLRCVCHHYPYQLEIPATTQPDRPASGKGGGGGEGGGLADGYQANKDGCPATCSNNEKVTPLSHVLPQRSLSASAVRSGT